MLEAGNSGDKAILQQQVEALPGEGLVHWEQLGPLLRLVTRLLGVKLDFEDAASVQEAGDGTLVIQPNR